MAYQLDPNCTGNFVIKAGNIYFQAGSKGLYRVPCAGGKPAEQFDDNKGPLAVDDKYVYFQGGYNGGLYRVDRFATKSGTAVQLDVHGGKMVVPGDGYVYFQATDYGLYRVACDAKESGTAVQLYEHAIENLAVHGGYVYFQASAARGLWRVSCSSSGPGTAQQLDERGGHLVVPGDGFVYFKAGSYGLYRVAWNGSPGSAVQLHEKCGDYIAVSSDGFVYFQAPGHGLCRVRCDANGPGTAVVLHEKCGFVTVPLDGYVYFQADGLYRVPRNAKGTGEAVQLDPYCGECIVVPGDGRAYFEGGSGSLYVTMLPNPFPPPPGYMIRVQNRYIEKEASDARIDAQLKIIEEVLGSAYVSNVIWMLNFTSIATSGVFPDAVADKINDGVRNYIQTLRPNGRLGAIMMDFPKPDLIYSIINFNLMPNRTPIRTVAAWMFNIGDDQDLLSQITIPGTHASCTWGASKINRCQKLALDEQLEAGIRFIDIRCRQLKDKFELYHEGEDLNLTFEYVLKICKAFLNENPTECIIMSVKEESNAAGNRKTFQEVFRDYVSLDSGMWHLDNTIPKLGDIRGKIVLARRFYIDPQSNAAQWGLDLSVWSENTTFRYPQDY